MNRSKTVWVDLYNCLYIISSKYHEISLLQSPIFEIFEELDSKIIMGLSETSLTFFYSEGWIDDSIRKELAKFRDYVNSIPSMHWNADDFDYLEDWGLARDWAISLMKKMKMEKNGWNSNGEIIIYTKNK